MNRGVGVPAQQGSTFRLGSRSPVAFARTTGAPIAPLVISVVGKDFHESRGPEESRTRGALEGI